MKYSIKSEKTILGQIFFPEYGDETRIWVHPLSKKVSDIEESWVRSRLQEMVENWTAHNQPVPGDYALHRGHFVIIANPSQVSGCGIDACFRVLAEINAYLGMGRRSENSVYYLEGNEVHSIPRYQLRSAISSGVITRETIIINLQLTLLKELRRGLLEVAAGEGVFADYFAE